MTNQEYFNKQKFSYKYENLNPGLNITNDCLIRAIMRASGRVTSNDWKSIYRELSLIAVEKYCSYNDYRVFTPYLESLGFKVYLNCDPDGSPLNYKEEIKLEDFCNTHIKGSYILGIAGHAIAYKDGIVYDCNKSIVSKKFYPKKCPAERYFRKYKKYIYWYAYIDR